MTWKEIEKGFRRKFDKQVVEWRRQNKARIGVQIQPSALADAVRFLMQKGQARFVTATSWEGLNGAIEIWYHFDFFQTPQLISLGVSLRSGEYQVPSISPLVKNADWIEREISELLGVVFIGHPNPGHLLLPKGWPKQSFPLRRD